MAAVPGAGLLIKRGNGATPTEAFTTIGGMRSPSVTMNGNPVDTTSADDVDVDGTFWRTTMNSAKTFQVSGELIIKTEQKSQIQGVETDFRTNLVTNYQIIIPVLGTYVVPVIVTNFGITASYDNTITANITLDSAGAPSFTAEV